MMGNVTRLIRKNHLEYVPANINVYYNNISRIKVLKSVKMFSVPTYYIIYIVGR